VKEKKSSAVRNELKATMRMIAQFFRFLFKRAMLKYYYRHQNSKLVFGKIKEFTACIVTLLNIPEERCGRLSVEGCMLACIFKTRGRIVSEAFCD